MILISACFVNVNCRYDGTSKPYAWIDALFRSGQAIPICPEVLGGLSIPRFACEIVGDNRVCNSEGIDCTAAFKKGAEKSLAIAKAVEAKITILKANSPSCGFGTIYDGSFSGVKVTGDGLTAALLAKNGIRIFNEFDEAEYRAFVNDTEFSEK